MHQVKIIYRNAWIYNYSLVYCYFTFTFLQSNCWKGVYPQTYTFYALYRMLYTPFHTDSRLNITY